MKILLNIDPRNEETSVTIHCKEITPDIQEILEYLKKNETGLIVGKDGENQHLIKPDEVQFFRSEGDTVTAATPEGIFKVKQKLYELEQSLPPHRFIRISKSVIANLYAMSHFEPSFNGTHCVHFKSGEKEYASRHYVGRIKEILRMNRRETK
ncbi:LytTR family transcriptional regulator [Cytobacillus oceanisediminis]|jgi:DNA-binding LytR/AlgR family response regulator|uniref:LytTR family DNA-binding domain-containing protein n=1 Tax=Cytobacillus oceanisediminis TaxID=665099 RepID=UPI001C2395C4|nr:LytTR family DNA-binding domain-containing protein [Cytobacillus oceanisediminis]MBU8731197.1 LytTR family transcriptional regulator [Cytobacillus oceanisediminis]